MSDLPKSPSIIVENIWHENAKNVYDARNKIQRYYDSETYQLQLDSHHQFLPDWDTKCIEMLHSSDAGEYSVLTSYVQGYAYAD